MNAPELPEDFFELKDREGAIDILLAPDQDPLPPDWMRVAGEMTAGRALAAQLAFFFRTSDPATFREIRRLLAIYQVHIGVEPIARPYECQACGFTTVSLDDLSPGGGHMVYTEAPYGSQDRYQRAHQCPGPVVPYVPPSWGPRP